MIEEEYQSSPDVDLEADKDVNENGYFFRGESPILWYDTFDDVKKYVLKMIKPVK